MAWKGKGRWEWKPAQAPGWWQMDAWQESNKAGKGSQAAEGKEEEAQEGSAWASAGPSSGGGSCVGGAGARERRTQQRAGHQQEFSKSEKLHNQLQALLQGWDKEEDQVQDSKEAKAEQSAHEDDKVEEGQEKGKKVDNPKKEVKIKQIKTVQEVLLAVNDRVDKMEESFGEALEDTFSEFLIFVKDIRKRLVTEIEGVRAEVRSLSKDVDQYHNFHELEMRRMAGEIADMKAISNEVTKKMKICLVDFQKTSPTILKQQQALAQQQEALDRHHEMMAKHQDLITYIMTPKSYTDSATPFAASSAGKLQGTHHADSTAACSDHAGSHADQHGGGNDASHPGSHDGNVGSPGGSPDDPPVGNDAGSTTARVDMEDSDSEPAAKKLRGTPKRIIKAMKDKVKEIPQVEVSDKE